MLPTITPSAMRHLESSYMQAKHVPGILLMEHAAMAVTEAIRSRLPANGRALFLCGPGNNGGDGYAAARLWRASGGQSLIWELTDRARGDAAVNRTLALESEIPIETLSACPSRLPAACELIVDALFGTGLSREPEGLAADLIALVNRAPLPVIAVDIPSGLNGATGVMSAQTVLADETVTFHRPKDGLFLRDGCVCAGRVTCAPILIPADYGDPDGLLVLQPSDVRRLLSARPINAHKGTFGRTVLMVGSPGMIGAAAFCARSCLRAGSGLVSILCSERILPVLQSLVPEAMCIALPEESQKAADLVRATLQRADKAAVGCGIGTDLSLLPLLEAFRDAPCPVVWDADALNLLALNPDLLPLKRGDIITPHPAEAARLLGWETGRVVTEPMEALCALHRRTGACVLLKGARSLMTDGERTAVNPIGTPALAKGGSGDILSGMLTALIGRTCAAENARLAEMQLAAYLHVRAAGRASEMLGEDCVLPEDIINAIRFE